MIIKCLSSILWATVGVSGGYALHFGLQSLPETEAAHSMLLIRHVRAHPEYADEVKRRFHEMGTWVGKVEGLRRFQIYVPFGECQNAANLKQQNEYLYIEEWQDINKAIKHLQSEKYRKVMAQNAQLQWHTMPPQILIPNYNPTPFYRSNFFLPNRMVQKLLNGSQSV